MSLFPWVHLPGVIPASRLQVPLARLSLSCLHVLLPQPPYQLGTSKSCCLQHDRTSVPPQPPRIALLCPITRGKWKSPRPTKPPLPKSTWGHEFLLWSSALHPTVWESRPSLSLLSVSQTCLGLLLSFQGWPHRNTGNRPSPTFSRAQCSSHFPSDALSYGSGDIYPIRTSGDIHLFSLLGSPKLNVHAFSPQKSRFDFWNSKPRGKLWVCFFFFSFYCLSSSLRR